MLTELLLHVIALISCKPAIFHSGFNLRRPHLLELSC